MRLPVTELRAPLVVLATDRALSEILDHQIQDVTAALTALLPKTPASILLDVPVSEC